MKILTVLGTRPEIIRLSLISRLLDAHCDHVIVHTGQNPQAELCDVFYRELGLREPNYRLEASSQDFGEQVGLILTDFHAVLNGVRPDRVVVLGDTTSGIACWAAARLGIPVFHLEAGNRCFDPEVPEELNRLVIDRLSTVLLPYTERSRSYLLAEGYSPRRIIVMGNPIGQILHHYQRKIDEHLLGPAMRDTRPGSYIVATIHRAECVDRRERLEQVLYGLELIADAFDMPVFFLTHPRTKNRLRAHGVSPRIRVCDAKGFLEFTALEQCAALVLTDSGTVQEEACIFGVPTVTVRRSTERMETVECGANMVCGFDAKAMLQAALLMRGRSGWTIPPEYVRPNVAEAAVATILGHSLM